MWMYGENCGNHPRFIKQLKLRLIFYLRPLAETENRNAASPGMLHFLLIILIQNHLG